MKMLCPATALWRIGSYRVSTYSKKKLLKVKHVFRRDFTYVTLGQLCIRRELV